jgi:hypothetical protein
MKARIPLFGIVFKMFRKIGLAPDVDVPDGTNAFDPAITWLRREVEKARH